MVKESTFFIACWGKNTDLRLSSQIYYLLKASESDYKHVVKTGNKN